MGRFKVSKETLLVMIKVRKIFFRAHKSRIKMK